MIYVKVKCRKCGREQKNSFSVSKKGLHMSLKQYFRIEMIYSSEQFGILQNVLNKKI